MFRAFLNTSVIAMNIFVFHWFACLNAVLRGFSVVLQLTVLPFKPPPVSFFIIALRGLSRK